MFINQIAHKPHIFRSILSSCVLVCFGKVKGEWENYNKYGKIVCIKFQAAEFYYLSALLGKKMSSACKTIVQIQIVVIILYKLI